MQTIDRAVQILHTLGGSPPALGVSEVARATGLSRSTVHRLLGSLEAHHLVRQLHDGRYALGPGLGRLARAAGLAMGLEELARPAMTWVRDRCDETVAVHIREDLFRITLAQVESTQELRRTYTDIGSRIPLNQGAPSKALLAFAPAEVREAVLSGPLPAATSKTLTEPARLEAEIRRIHREGYAVSLGERVPWVSSVAVPVPGPHEEPAAALSVSGPSKRLSRRELVEIVPLLRSAADGLLGGGSGPPPA